MQSSTTEFSRRTTLTLAVLLTITGWMNHPLTAEDKTKRPQVGDQAPDFELQSIEKQSVKLSKLVQDGPVILIVLRGYPGYQCPLCTQQAGQFLSQAKKFDAAKARLVFVYPGPAENLKRHAEDFVRGKSFPKNAELVLDPDYEFTKSYGLRWDAPRETAYPSTFVIDTSRKIKFAKVSMTHGGRVSADEVLKVLRAEQD